MSDSYQPDQIEPAIRRYWDEHKADRAESGGAVSLGALSRVGLYTVEGVVPADATIAVNLVDAGESAIGTADSVDVAGRRMAGTGLGDTAPREVWHWFALGALALSTVEWLLFAGRTRV